MSVWEAKLAVLRAYREVCEIGDKSKGRLMIFGKKNCVYVAPDEQTRVNKYSFIVCRRLEIYRVIDEKKAHALGEIFFLLGRVFFCHQICICLKLGGPMQ